MVDLYQKHSDYILYLGSHFEWEHIELDMKEKYKASCLEELDFFDLEELATSYDYFKYVA